LISTPRPPRRDAFSNSLFEAGHRQGPRPCIGKARLVIAQNCRQSHHIYGKQGSIVRLSVPIHGNQPLKTGLAKHLLKLASIDPDDI
jgi:hypothetical protein